MYFFPSQHAVEVLWHVWHGDVEGFGVGWMDTNMGIGMIWQLEKFLKNYNIICLIGHHYDTSMAPKWSVCAS